MKALVVEGEWSPKEDYKLCQSEKLSRKAIIGSQVWRNPSFSIKDIPTPDPGDEEVLIRVKSCGVCGSDTHLYETDREGYIMFSGLTKLPCVLGHEFSGIVEKVGCRVAGFRKGDLVAVESVMWCGMCTPCRSGSPNQCKDIDLIGLSVNGAFADYISVNSRYCWKINDFKDKYLYDEIFDIGALIEPLGCAYNGIFISGGGFKPGATVAIHGVGPIGLGAVSLARVAGASIIIAFDIVDERVELALQMGADLAFNINRLDGLTPSDIIMEHTKGEGVDLQVEAAGAAPFTIPEMEKSMAVNGKIIYLGRAVTSTSMCLDTLVSGASKIIGSRGHAGYGIYPQIIKLIASGRINPKAMITSHYTIDRVMEAISSSSMRTDGKIVVNI